MKSIAFAALGLLSGCKAFDKVACYEARITQARTSTLYRETQASAAAGIPRLVAMKNFSLYLRNAFVDSSIVSAFTIEQTLFFSPDSSKCVVPVLLQTIGQEDFDQILYVQGTRKETGWTFATDRMPRVARVRSVVKKRMVEGQWVNHSFADLSQLARQNVLEFGVIKWRGCAIDPEFWFKE